MKVPSRFKLPPFRAVTGAFHPGCGDAPQKVKWSRSMGNTAMIELRLRPYHDVRGAVFRSDAGWEVPTGYGPLDAEVRAVRTRAGVIDRSDRAKVRVTGADRVTFLDGLFTADMKTLVEGMSAYALLLNEKSRVLGDLRGYAFSDAFVLAIHA